MGHSARGLGFLLHQAAEEGLTGLQRRKMQIKPYPLHKVQVLPEQEPQLWVLLRAKSRKGEGGGLLLCACLGVGWR